MIVIEVDSEIAQRRDTTESWEYTNPILPDGQLGWEVDIYGNPVGVKMGNGATAWTALGYWFGGTTINPASFPLVGGTTANPVVITLSAHPGFDSNAGFIYKVGTSPNFTRFTDQQVSETSTGFSVFLHDDGTGKVAEDGVLIMKK